MKIAVIITDAGQAANCDGGKCETRVTVFELTEEIERFVKQAKKSGYNTVSFAIVEESSR